ncbi:MULTISPECIES: hypothetical protein [unclassified Streptomyces]
MACAGGATVPSAGETGFTREGSFVRVVCGSDLPQTWNVDPAA